MELILVKLLVCRNVTENRSCRNFSFGELNSFFFFFLSFYHNKIHPVTNYKAIKNKINKTRQHKTIFFNKQNNNNNNNNNKRQ